MRVEGKGPRTARWAVVGEAPGYNEDRTGEPFVGKSGQLLRETLQRVGLDPSEAYITNVVKERPPGNRTPTTKEINEEVPNLSQELASLPNLEAVLCVGAVPLRALCSKTGVTKHRGLQSQIRKEYDSIADRVQVFVTLHPAAVLRNNNNHNGWLQDLAAFAQLVTTEPLSLETLYVDNSVAYEAFRLSVQDRGALDIETTIGNPFQDDLTLVSVAVTFDGERVFVFPDGPYLRMAKAQLEQVNWIMHNGSFDRLVMKTKGYNLPLAHDTMAMAYLLHENERKALEVLASVWLGLPPYKDVDYKHILDEPWDKVAEMNARDTAITFRLFRVLADEMNKHPNLSRVYQWIMMPAITTLIDMTITGVPVDQQYLDDLTAIKTTEMAQLLTELQAKTPPPVASSYGAETWKGGGTFNPSSPEQVRHVIYDLYGAEPSVLTDTGVPSTNASVVNALLMDASEPLRSFLSLLKGYREVSRHLTGYLTSWPPLMGADGRLHPRYNPARVSSGRLSSDAPNIQNVPRSKEFRNVFGCDDLLWVKADYSQIELRIAAWLAEEEAMLDAYAQNEDLHTLTASRILGKQGAAARQVGKTLNFSLLYGAGANKLREIARNDYGIEFTQSQAYRYREAFFDSYPALQRWHRTMEDFITTHGKALSPLGRVRWLPEAQGYDEAQRHAAIREGINHPVQSFASDLLLMSLVRLRKNLSQYGDRVQFIAEVHDEIDFLVDPDLLAEVAPIIRDTMQDISWTKRWGIEVGVPIVAEITAGPRWGTQEGVRL